MPDASAMLQVERRLVELACPPAVLQRKLRELDEHREDLKHEALEEGLSEADAEIRADKLLGEPYALAEHLAAALRQTSWWGRHPIVGFCLVPPFVILLTIVMMLAICLGIGRFCIGSDLANLLIEDKSSLLFIQHIWEIAYLVSIIFVAALFCRLSRRAIAGIKWAGFACIVCALNGWLLQIQIGSHVVSAGYGPRLHWLPMLTPLAVAGVFWWMRWRSNTTRGVNAAEWKEARRKFVEQAKGGNASAASAKFVLPRNHLVTPTSVIATILILSLASLCFVAWKAVAADRTREAGLHSKIWPAERSEVMQKIAARQKTKETSGETTIDLRDKITAGLNDSFGGMPHVQGNTLTELPAGIHNFGGVPFDVEGRVQLWGRGLAGSGQRFPNRVKDIAVGRRCNHIYLLHSAGFITDNMEGVTVGKLVLHYSDGSQAELEINAGENVQDWWGPIYKTDSNAKLREITAPGTELAWVGSNPRIKARAPEDSLRLYKSTFDNPHPDREISSIDYVSTLTQSAPFLVGITVE